MHLIIATLRVALSRAHPGRVWFRGHFGLFCGTFAQMILALSLKIIAQKIVLSTLAAIKILCLMAAGPCVTIVARGGGLPLKPHILRCELGFKCVKITINNIKSQFEQNKHKKHQQILQNHHDSLDFTRQYFTNNQDLMCYINIA